MKSFLRDTTYTGPVRAVILDWAGTTVDYGSFAPVASFLRTFADRGVEITPDEVRPFMGLRKRDHVEAICRLESVAAKWRLRHGHPPRTEDVQALYARSEADMAACAATYSDPVPGLFDAVDCFRAAGIRIGSSTGYTRPVMETLVQAAGAKGYRPDAVVCSSDVPAGRPAPYMCFRNAIEMQVYPLAAVVKIGDTVSDIHEGLNAGMWTIGLSRTGNELGLPLEETRRMAPDILAGRLRMIKRKLLRAGAHYVVEGIGDCPAVLDEINRRLGCRERP